MCIDLSVVRIVSHQRAAKDKVFLSNGMFEHVFESYEN